MGLAELFVAVVIVGVSCVNASFPGAVWLRSHDPRFLLLVGGNGGLAVLGLIWVWGQLPVGAPSWSSAQLPVLLVALFVTVILLLAALWPPRS